MHSPSIAPQTVSASLCPADPLPPRRFVLPAVAASVPRARRILADTLGGWAVPASSDGLYHATLLLGELVANAVQHAHDGPVAVTLTWHDAVLHVEVADTSPRPPRVPAVRPGPDAETGRGLYLVGSLSDGLAWHPTPDGKTVVFRMTGASLTSAWSDRPHEP